MKRIALLAACWLCTAAAGPEARPPLALRYLQPAEDWQTQALPVGNGRLGAMIFGGAERERLQLNESSLWTGDEKDTGRYQDLADLFLEFSHGPAAAYERRLDLATATHTITYSAGGVDYRREYFASFPQQVIVFRFTAGKAGAYSGTLRLEDAHKARTSFAGDTLVAAGALDNGLAYESQVRVLHVGGRLTPGPDGVVRFDGADSLTLVFGAGTSYAPLRAKSWRGEHPHDRVSKQVEAAAAKSVDSLRAVHVADYSALFARVALDLGASEPAVRALATDRRLVEYASGGRDPELEALFFQFGRYLLVSSSRGSLPANLQGLWNDSNDPPWRSDYHSNINVQMNYWPAEVANLSECHLPFFDYVDSLRGVRADATRQYYSSEVDPKKVERKAVRGWTVQTENNIFGAGSFKWNPPGSAWYAQHYWEHYAFTRDREFLRSRAYPVLKEVCEFWDDHLVTMPDGRLVTPDGWSPEHGPEERGVTYDQEIVWDLFTNYIEASKTLGVDAEYRSRVEVLRDRLLKPRVGRWGQLQEWMDDRDDPADQHRHVSHLFALHPGRQISPVATPDLARAAGVSLTARGDKSTGWAMAWRINFWARLLDGNHAYTLLRNLVHVVGRGAGIDYGAGGGVYSNLFDAHPPFQIDGNFGATAGMAEMLLQSQNGELHLLPALPKAWPTGSVTGLRARGNIVVDITWHDGRLVSARLVSPEATTATARVGQRVTTVRLRPGAAVTVR
jgi:alpha-L-fucosidase 2